MCESHLLRQYSGISTFSDLHLCSAVDHFEHWIMVIVLPTRYNMSLRELAENKMIFDDELEQVLSNGETDCCSCSDKI